MSRRPVPDVTTEIVVGHGGFADEPGDDDLGALFPTDLADGPSVRRARAPVRGRRTFWMTSAVVTSLALGVVAGATGRAPQTVPGPTVTVSAPAVTVTAERAGQTGQARNGQAQNGRAAADQPELDGIWTVLHGVAPGHYEGRPTVEGGTCHWMRIGPRVDGTAPILEQVSTTTTTRVRILETDARFASFGCSWYREV